MPGGRKEKLRRALRKKRDAIPGDERRRAGGSIARRLRDLPEYRTASSVMLFITHQSEVPTERMIENAVRDGKKVLLPRIDPATDALVSAEVAEVRKDLKKGRFGILEPDIERCRSVEAGAVGLVVVPGIAYDLKGHRLGYGRGYYDRWLKNFPADKRAGVAFDRLLVRSLPNGSHDVPVGTVITEKRTVRTSSYGVKQTDMKERSTR